MSVEELVKFLRSAAVYFEERPTMGEDRAHWSNVYNSENCDKAADKLEELAAEVDGWKERVQYLSRCIDEKSADEDRLKAALAEAKRENEALREALEAMLEPHEDEPCQHDHHGYCQAHFLQEDCCVAKARATLARNAGGKDGE